MAQPESDLGGGDPILSPDDVDAWPVAMFVGLATIALGAILLFWPSETLTVLSILLGIQILLFGVFRLISAFSSKTENAGLVGFIGVIGMVIGVAVLRHPFETVAVLAALLGIVWIVGGAIEFIGAIADRRKSNRVLLAFSGALSIVAGIVVVSWPAPTVTVVAWISGLYLVAFGLVFCYIAFQLRRLED